VQYAGRLRADELTTCFTVSQYHDLLVVSRRLTRWCPQDKPPDDPVAFKYFFVSNWRTPLQ
jgi:hypothetical protein